MEPKHLRALEVGCGPNKQCVWLPMPHYKEPWCSGVDFVYDIDYRALQGELSSRDVKTLPVSGLRMTQGPSTDGTALIELQSGGVLPSERVLVLEGVDLEVADPLSWIPLDGLTDWRKPFSQKILGALQVQGGRPLSPAQVTIVKTCLHSLITSKD